MVLPGRIELTTSPLPRGCSTTELRQRLARGVLGGKSRLLKRAASMPQEAEWRNRRPTTPYTCPGGPDLDVIRFGTFASGSGECREQRHIMVVGRLQRRDVPRPKLTNIRQTPAAPAKRLSA